ncbi:MAG: N-acetylmuramoyl-L-alanine amidase-like domain-containing protein [Thermodesulfobacteriota bacterium]
MGEEILTGEWTEDRLNNLLKEASAIADPGARAAFISERFLNTPYAESTLTGGIDTEELFVINLSAFDCFTFIDCIEAMRSSASYSLFKENLKNLRYRSGTVGFKNRNHFFTDWAEFNSGLVVDVTEEIGGERSASVAKRLNVGKGGTPILPGIEPRPRELAYIPSTRLDEEVIGRLATGDYVGIYSEVDGLDVSHVGIIIKKGQTPYMRHASSSKAIRAVVDDNLKEYLKGRPGIILLRPKA